MAGLEAMASLAPKTSSLLRNRDNVPWEVVCMALAKIPKEASMYGRLKYALELSYYSRIRMILINHVYSIRWGDTQRWSPSADLKIDLAELALKESLEPMCCPKCSGRGQIFVSSKLYKCTLCLGVGIKSFSDVMRAKYLEVPRATFQKNIRYNYFGIILPLIATWETQLERAMRRI